MQQFEDNLKEWFKNHPKVLIALSGGVDSCLVAYAARKFCGLEGAIAVVGDSPSLKRKDFQLAISFCESNDIKYVVIHPNELENDQYKVNPIDRCFWCKSSLYEEMIEFRDANYADFVLVNGNNKSDWSDYRPGLKAADKFQAKSPLADCGLMKDDIRQLANKWGLTVWDKPASPCLSSRFPYGELITIDKLKLIEEAETILMNSGFGDARVRYFGELAKLEVPNNQIQKLKDEFPFIALQIMKLGFRKVEIDEEGLVSGKLNRGIV